MAVGVLLLTTACGAGSGVNSGAAPPGAGTGPAEFYCPITSQTGTQIVGAPLDMGVLRPEYCAFQTLPLGALRFVDVMFLYAPSATVQVRRQQAATAASGIQIIDRNDLGAGSFESIPIDGSDASYVAEVSARNGGASIAVSIRHNGYLPEDVRRMLDQFASSAAGE